MSSNNLSLETNRPDFNRVPANIQNTSKQSLEIFFLKYLVSKSEADSDSTNSHSLINTYECSFLYKVDKSCARNIFTAYQKISKICQLLLLFVKFSLFFSRSSSSQFFRHFPIFFSYIDKMIKFDKISRFVINFDVARRLYLKTNGNTFNRVFLKFLKKKPRYSLFRRLFERRSQPQKYRPRNNPNSIPREYCYRNFQKLHASTKPV